ncbi:MAG: enolase C-terminal domain-like protein, partial [Pseudomonadota bacterium]|nr:enolase C-terminal domain-like protein [Pseudomonadota bacterium]MEC8216341.1 enolase C-terminal domain-like protein [Pseudomonadota bacterium]MEC8270251.1 enolase C-terminal domain-like protein [Pseudomonadota bacterium]
SKFGGISAMRRARDLCVTLGAKICIEDTWGSDVTTAAALHLAAATPEHAIMNSCALSAYVAPRLDPKAQVRVGGLIAPPDGPGLGVSPHPEMLGAPILDLTG